MELIYAALTSYALTFIIASSSVLDKPRNWIMSKTPWLIARKRHLLECRMCSGFWVSLGVGLYFNNNILAVYGLSYFLATQERG